MPELLEDAVQKLKSMAGTIPVAWKRPRPNRLYFDVRAEDVRGLALIVSEDFGARFATATGLDAGDELEVIYHFVYDAVGLVVNLRVKTPKSEARLPSLTTVVPPAEWIEREIRDLLGVEFDGHPRPERFILADDWPEGVYPLRKEGRDGA